MGDLTDINNCYTAVQERNQDINRVQEQWNGEFGGNVSVKTFIAECRTRNKIRGIFILEYLVAKWQQMVANDIIGGKNRNGGK